ANATAVASAAVQTVTTEATGKKPPPAPVVLPQIVELIVIPAPQIVTQTGTVTPAGRLPDLPTSTLLPATTSASVQLNMQRQDSGGGDNGTLAEIYSAQGTTEDSDSADDSSARLENAKSTSEVVARAAFNYLPSVETSSAVDWKQACTACFATEPA